MASLRERAISSLATVSRGPAAGAAAARRARFGIARRCGDAGRDRPFRSAERERGAALDQARAKREYGVLREVRRASRGGTQRRFLILVSIPSNKNRTQDRSQDSRRLHIFSHFCLSMLLYRALTYLYLAPLAPLKPRPHPTVLPPILADATHSTCAVSTYTSHPLLMLLHLQPYQKCHRVTDWKSDSGVKEPYMASRMHSSHCLPWRLRLW